jgi:DeoR/GlpR family transcriptional regulator of sugar metabolism
MLAAQRRSYLLEKLQRDGRVVAKTVAAELGLSEDSIRRDLRDLADEGLCLRVYGGALPVSPAVADYGTRTGMAQDSKQRVAAAAAALIRDGGSVILDGGTTALAVARAIPSDLSCTVITHSPTVAAALVAHPAVEVFVIGGRLFKHSAVASGAAAAEAAAQVSADLFFLGVTGVHGDVGLTTGDADEAAMKRLLSSRAAETYVLASTEKIGTASAFQVVSLAAVAGIITDAPEGDQTVAALRKRGIPVVGA